MASEIAHKLKTSLFKRRRRSAASIASSTRSGADGLESPSTSQSTTVRSSILREPSRQTLSFYQTDDTGSGTGGTSNQSEHQQESPTDHGLENPLRTRTIVNQARTSTSTSTSTSGDKKEVVEEDDDKKQDQQATTSCSRIAATVAPKDSKPEPAPPVDEFQRPQHLTDDHSTLETLLGLSSDPPGNDLQQLQPPPPPLPLSPSSSPSLGQPQAQPHLPPQLQLPPTTPGPGISSLASINEDESPTHHQPPSSATTVQTDAHHHDLDAPSSPSHHHGRLTLDQLPTPTITLPPLPPASPSALSAVSISVHTPLTAPPSATATASVTPSARPPAPPRRQSLVSNRHASFIQSLLQTPLPPADTVRIASDVDEPSSPGAAPIASVFARHPISSIPILDANMSASMRKIWVKRPHASATLVTINENDLVDDVRDMILRKYANSLGRTFDSPDLTLRICPRDSPKDRLLGPEEPMVDTIDSYFPGGQTVNEALIIDIPRRTPKASPHVPHSNSAAAIYYTDDVRPSENGEGYFPPVPNMPSPHLPITVPTAANGVAPHSITVLSSGHLPTIPSPGGTRSRSHRERQDRPRLGRTHTSSPVMHNGIPASASATTITTHAAAQHFRPRHTHSRTHSSSSEHVASNATPSAKSPGPGPEPSPSRITSTPPPRVTSPRLQSARPKKSKKIQPDYSNMAPNMLNGSVPPISVLIVEDNPINLKLLEAFVKRLKVRWQTAMNGRDAVKKWRSGGFHLVLMDIQLPVMNGLEATREIRRLESVNNIGVFSSTPGSLPEETTPKSEELAEQDRLENSSLFKSPVIIVALTASSLQSDRHEALAAGCNDFLTKPVNFVWLERKVMEWGCMQALIDFDGWRKWKDYSAQADELEAAKKAQVAKTKSKKSRSSLASAA